MLARIRKHQWLIFGVLTVIVLGVMLVAYNARKEANSQMRLDPQIIANMTEIPQSAPLSGAAADQVNHLKTMIEACRDYSPERRTQVLQNIQLLLNPALIPPDLLIIYGANPHGTLIFAVASVTSNQWKLNGRSATSCLLPIGRIMNQMLVDSGQEPLTDFGE